MPFQIRSIVYYVVLFCALVVVCFIAAATPAHGLPSKKLPPVYRHWIEAEVPYIISTDERKEFLSLSTDAQRDAFIKAFWDVRNPDPHSDINTYKEEHYRRLAYVNQTFGTLNGDDGWRTDRGRIYITLGAPKQKAEYLAAQNVRPILIWFYQTETAALPTYFNILFFKESMAEEYRIYSPYQDGPARLVTSNQDINDQKKSYATIQNSLGDEVARTSLSLIPSEPIDTSDYKPSLTSDSMLSVIRSLPDQSITKQQIALRRAQERVTSSVFLGQDEAEMQTAIFRDEDARMTLNYLLRFRQPDPTFVGKLRDQKTGYSMTLRTTVLTAVGVTAYEEEDTLTGVVTEAQAQRANRKSFGAEGRLPLAPGQYKIATTLTNNLTHSAVRQVSNVDVPAPLQSDWGISSVMAFTAQPPVATPKVVLPFSIAGMRFAPQGVQSVVLHAGEKLRLLFQLWSKPEDVPALQRSKIGISYVFGAVHGGETKDELEEVNAGDFSASGTLLTGHTLSTEGQTPGTYRLVITATDESTQKKAYATMFLRIVDPSEAAELWTAYDTVPAGARTAATDDYKRGLCAVALGQKEAAKNWLQRSISEDGEYPAPVAKLADLYTADRQYSQLAQLSHNSAVARDLDEGTLLLMANADNKVGDLKSATELLEAELQSHPPSASVYLALAQLYDQAGNPRKAKEYRQQASAF